MTQLHTVVLQVIVWYVDRAVKFKCKISLPMSGICGNNRCGCCTLNSDLAGLCVSPQRTYPTAAFVK